MLQEKNCVKFSKPNAKFWLRLHYDGDESYLYETCKFKTNDNKSWYKFYLGSTSKDFAKDEKTEICLNGNDCM